MIEDFTKKSEIVFISYDEVIKNPYPFILRQIINKYKDIYSQFLDMSKFEHLDDANLTRLCIQRTDKNIFRYLAKIDFDVDETLADIMVKFQDMYMVEKLLPIGKSIFTLLTQKFTEKIYIHTKYYDKRIHLDIQENFNNMNKVNYVTGDMVEVLRDLNGITTYIFNDVLDISHLLFLNKIEYTNVLVANYGYNYAMVDNKLTLRLNAEELVDKRIFKFATFSPIELNEKSFSQL